MQFWCILHSDKVSSRTLNISQSRHRSQTILHKKRAGDLKGRTTRSLALILKRIIKHEKFPKARGTTTSSNLLSLYHTSMSLSSPCNKKPICDNYLILFKNRHFVFRHIFETATVIIFKHSS